MKKLVGILISLTITIILIVIVFTVDFSAGATNIYFDSVAEIVKGNNPIIFKNIMYGANCILGFIVNSSKLSEHKESLYSVLDGLLALLKYVVNFFIWLISSLWQKFINC